MTDEVRARIFEPFFTTKEATGTGLGLWVSAEVIRKHHGSVYIRSCAAPEGENSRAVRTGTVFMIFFPSVRDEEKAMENLQPSTQHQEAASS